MTLPISHANNYPVLAVSSYPLTTYLPTMTLPNQLDFGSKTGVFGAFTRQNWRMVSPWIYLNQRDKEWKRFNLYHYTNTLSLFGFIIKVCPLSYTKALPRHFSECQRRMRMMPRRFSSRQNANQIPSKPKPQGMPRSQATPTATDHWQMTPTHTG